MAGTRRVSLYQTQGARKKGDKKGSGMLAIVFGRGTNLDIVAQDTLPGINISQFRASILQSNQMRHLPDIPRIREGIKKNCFFSSEKL